MTHPPGSQVAIGDRKDNDDAQIMKRRIHAIVSPINA
jgi:hypothetical protein